ncbi:MAG: aminotransferase class I/II-fold pyridoxal phosphate-dependent enzyme [Candidatus Latescibacterota bacterium]|nr:MAG: aminotransferase class I/II-fold pyridoxal phosphate-dependent enzyme [Candidatus Latescibacterota bacterium]
MTDFQPFLMERFMSMYEHDVEYNLSESGVHPVALGELLEEQPGALEALVATPLNYPRVNGTPQLREHIAALYAGAATQNVLVTVGAIEANYNAIQALLSPGDEIVIMLPNYMQIWGIARNLGLGLKSFRLREERDWAPDLAELEEVVTSETKLIAVCNPNNPTGAVLEAAEMDAIVGCAARVGAWILADEVYSGAERLNDEPTPSFYGRYDRVIAVGSLSKAYGLPGLRIGWVVAPKETVDAIWARHEYTTISATMLGNELAAIALSSATRARLLGRTRRYVRDGFRTLEEWLRTRGEVFRVVPPQAAAIAFLHYALDINSTELAERLRRQKSVLLVPGDHFGMDRFVRVSFGLPRDQLLAALERIAELIDELSLETR